MFRVSDWFGLIGLISLGYLGRFRFSIGFRVIVGLLVGLRIGLRV